MELTFEQERLTKHFAGSFSAQQVAECLEETAARLRRGARILSYIPVLAEHAARDRLRARLALRDDGTKLGEKWVVERPGSALTSGV